jgi:hypothetical protein
MRNLDLVTGDSTMPTGAMTAERRTSVPDSMISAGHLPEAFDISQGYDPSFPSR